MFFLSCVFMLSLLVFATLWSPAGKGLTSWLLFVMFNCVVVTLPCGILVQVWYLILLIPDICHLLTLNIKKMYIVFLHFISVLINFKLGRYKGERLK